MNVMGFWGFIPKESAQAYAWAEKNKKTIYISVLMLS